MFEYTCFDDSGNSIDCLWQYDVSRTINIDLSGLQYSGSIVAQASSKYMEGSFDIECTVKDNIASVVINSWMLQQHCVLHIYIREIVGLFETTIACIDLPIRKRSKPTDFIPEYDIQNIATVQEAKQFLGIE